MLGCPVVVVSSASLSFGSSVMTLHHETALWCAVSQDSRRVDQRPQSGCSTFIWT